MMNHDYSQVIQEQEEMHFYSCVTDVMEAFSYHGAKTILAEIDKNPKFHKQMVEFLKTIKTDI